MKSGKHWIVIIIAFLSITAVLDSVLVYLALTDPSFAVESDYYQKALNWDDQVAQNQLNRELGWALSMSFLPARSDRTVPVTVVVRDSKGEVLPGATVEALLFPHARAGRKESLEFKESDGVHNASLRFARSGLWQARIRVRHGDSVFTQIRDLEMR